jgi:DNA-binding NarL/FixJ family response regulator
MFDNMEIVVPCLEAGVDGYILKGEKNFNIYNAVKQVYEKGHYYSPEITDLLALSLRPYKENRIILTKREKEILDLISIGKTAKEVAVVLKISKRTVENTRNKMLDKFDARNTIEMIIKAQKKGILKIDTYS